MVRSEFPAELVFRNRQPMPGLQMLLEHFPLVAALYADDVVGTN
jgi:hypothetical protein